ncbi:MAG: hypothetical protein AABY22_02375 [Nanoarchaeota archaeon]
MEESLTVISYSNKEIIIPYDNLSDKLIFNLRQELIIQQIDNLNPKYIIFGKKQYEYYLGWQNYYFGDKSINWQSFGKIPIVMIQDSSATISCNEMYSMNFSRQTNSHDAVLDSIYTQEHSLNEKDIKPEYLVVGISEYVIIKREMESRVGFMNSSNTLYKFNKMNVVLLPLKHYTYVCSDPMTSFLRL